jgi:thioester reductase-like protein
MPDRETFFITGFPGFIADRLLERLARKESSFILLVQPSWLERARHEVGRIATLTGRAREDFQIVLGYISQRFLGFCPPFFEFSGNQTTRIFHLAAFYFLAV